jgi:hypothetical protein
LKGIDGLVAAAILLMIAVAGGMLIYNYVMNYLSLPQQYANLKIVSAKIIVTGSTSTLSLEVSNLGNIPVSITSVTVYTSSGSYTISEVNTQVPAGTTTTINININSTITSAIVNSAVVYVSASYTSSSGSGVTELVKTPVYQ